MRSWTRERRLVSSILSSGPDLAPQVRLKADATRPLVVRAMVSRSWQDATDGAFRLRRACLRVRDRSWCPALAGPLVGDGLQTVAHHRGLNSKRGWRRRTEIRWDVERSDAGDG